MQRTVGPTSRRLHLLMVSAVAIGGLGLLAMVAFEMAFGESAYGRDMALLGLIITAPLWLAGVVAAVEAISVARGRGVTRRRALLSAAVVVAGGAFLAKSFGLAELVALLLTRPDRVGFEWPAVMLITADGSGQQFVYLDQPGFWLPIAALALGTLALVAALRDGPAEAERGAAQADASPAS